MNIELQARDHQANRSEIQDDICIQLETKPQNYWKYAIFGSIGCGKSTTLANLIEYFTKPKKYYNKIFFFSSSAEKEDKFTGIVSALKEKGRFFDDLIDSELQQCIDLIDEEVKKVKDHNKKVEEEGEGKLKKYKRYLFIFDDVLNSMPRSTDKCAFNRFMTNHRHSKSDVILTCQVMRGLNTKVRKNLQIISLFPCSNGQEIATYLEEINVSKEDFTHYYNAMLANPDEHAFLTINTQKKLARFFNKFEYIGKSQVFLKEPKKSKKN